ncbi:MAG: type II toxin-antitoxin system Phd/YefM family antitoxin [Goleter apudmare HA4340-LM2]|jgi:prevent-host-death family protein|nr:type II toxin-antitoxin system Phd/YefM family antitoxin [Goleter apudmare HA4340-LM2]
METVNVDQAKTNLSELLLRVELGEEIIISNRGIAIAKLVPYFDFCFTTPLLCDNVLQFGRQFEIYAEYPTDCD